MKITVKEEQKEKNQDVPFDEIPVGMVYIVNAHDGPIALKLGGNEAVLLHFSWDDNQNWLILADTYYKSEPAYKILGKLTEIIIEKV